MEAIMEAVSISDFRKKISDSFNRAVNGNVFIRRKNDYFILTKVDVKNKDLIITPELQKRIDEAHKNYKEGKFVACSTKEELHAFLESL